MTPSSEGARDRARLVKATALGLGLDSHGPPCCACCAGGADGGRCATVRSLRLRSLAGAPALAVKPRRLRLRERTRVWGLRAPTPRGLRSGEGAAAGTAVTTPGRVGAGALGRARRMGLLRGQEDGGVVGLVLDPERIDDPHPLVGQGAHGHAVAFALPALALIIGPGPRLLLGA